MNSTHGNMASLTRGSVLGVLFGWGQETHIREHTREYWYTQTHTGLVGLEHAGARMNTPCIIQACNNPMRKPILVPYWST